MIMAKGSKIYGLYILAGSNDFHDKNNLRDLRSRLDRCLKVFWDHINEFCRRQEVKPYLTTSLSWIIFLRKDGVIPAYLVERCPFTRIHFQMPTEVCSRKP